MVSYFLGSGRINISDPIYWSSSYITFSSTGRINKGRINKGLLNDQKQCKSERQCKSHWELYNYLTIGCEIILRTVQVQLVEIRVDWSSLFLVNKLIFGWTTWFEFSFLKDSASLYKELQLLIDLIIGILFEKGC